MSMSERQVRKARIDPRLQQAGWSTIMPYRPQLDPATLRATAVEEWETAAGPADYALCDGGTMLGVVEAKKPAVGPQEILTQGGATNIDFLVPLGLLSVIIAAALLMTWLPAQQAARIAPAEALRYE